MKKTFFLLMAICIAAAVRAQKIEHTFWDCAFGVSSEQVYNNLVANNLQPILTEDGIFLKDNSIYSILFQTIGMKFTSEDAFYNIFGYNKFDSKQDAMDNFNEALGKIREQYPNVQTMSRTEGCLKLYAYADADSGDAFSIGLYKGNNAFFVRLNIFSDYLLKRGK